MENFVSIFNLKPLLIEILINRFVFPEFSSLPPCLDFNLFQ